MALAPAVAVLRPSAIDGRSVVAGARLWRGGGASVLVVDDLRASPEALLSALHMADVRRLDVLVVVRPGVAAATDVAALVRRFPPRLVLGPTGHRLPGEVVVPPVGAVVAAGGLVVRFQETSPRLAVDVASARGPPGSAEGLAVSPVRKRLAARVRLQLVELRVIDDGHQLAQQGALLRSSGDLWRS